MKNIQIYSPDKPTGKYMIWEGNKFLGSLNNPADILTLNQQYKLMEGGYKFRVNSELLNKYL